MKNEQRENNIRVIYDIKFEGRSYKPKVNDRGDLLIPTIIENEDKDGNIKKEIYYLRIDKFVLATVVSRARHDYI